MAGWSAVAGTHNFVVPDQARAQALATALAAYGFALVTARPGNGDGWLVTAFDEGPYPADTVGHRSIDAVGRHAAVLARQHGGYPRGGSRCDPSMLQMYRAEAPIVQTNLGMRPPIPSVALTLAPPAAPLALTPDSVMTVTVDLSGLDAIDWTQLGHAHGSAEDVPGLIRALAHNTDNWAEVLDELFGDDLLHQGTCYSATAPALSFIVGLVASGTFPASRRLDLYWWLLYAADRWADSQLIDADRAAAENRLPKAAPWTQDVHQAIDNELPALLARWNTEPPATQYVLACLAALNPQHGWPIAQQLSALAADYAGTQPGAYLQLADALVRADDDRALMIASDIIGWADDLDPGWLDAPGTSASIRSGHVLAEGAPRTAQPSA